MRSRRGVGWGGGDSLLPLFVLVRAWCRGATSGGLLACCCFVCVDLLRCVPYRTVPHHTVPCRTISFRDAIIVKVEGTFNRGEIVMIQSEVKHHTIPSIPTIVYETVNARQTRFGYCLIIILYFF